MDFGLQNYNARHIASDNKRLDDLLPNILLLKIFLFVIYLCLTISVAFPIGYIQYKFLFVILINQFLSSFIIYLRTNISGHQYFITDSLLSILDKLLMILFCGILIWGNTSIKLSILSFVVAQFLAYFITALVGLLLSIRLLKDIKFNFSIDTIKLIIKESLPYATVYFLMTTYYRIDGVMLEKMKGSYEAGIYAQGYRIIESINNIGYLLSIILLPIFSHYLAKNKNIKEVLIPSLNIVLVIILAIVGVFYFQSRDIITLLYHSDIQYSSQVFSWLVLNFIPIGFLYVLGTMLTANECFKIMIPALIIAVILNIVLNYFLIQKEGAIGAAQATFITQIFMLLVYGIYSMYKFKIQINFIVCLKLIVFITISIFSIEMLIQNYEGNSIMTISFRTILYLMIVLVSSIVLKFINKDLLKIKVGRH